ncbi:CopG family transcriptional regulator [Chroococcidiopsis sp. CCNUC1]|uniref:CopG family transcriptional regulator n=1 Tax=Chroococcidiopsis sp. CCNUC1 TaxID=2653189 RepID=UPI002021F7FA|nr:CopG family transcriptional regulator [Chroococcidiopsis sp. CCNUC1]URD48452.1 CopG family transcriptional regulator [Chroococcidiopsis sp. CCNUC1]
MSSYLLQLPEELIQEVRQLAAASQIPLEQWLIAAITQQLEVERSLSRLRQASQVADYERFDQILARVPDIEPMLGDEL